jgi:hypothetical protein
VDTGIHVVVVISLLIIRHMYCTCVGSNTFIPSVFHRNTNQCWVSASFGLHDRMYVNTFDPTPLYGVFDLL